MRAVAAVVAAACAWLWMSGAGPPAALVSLFDPASDPELSLAGGAVLTLQLPRGTSEAEVEAVGAGLRRAVDGTVLVEAASRRVRIAPTDASPAGRSVVEAVLSSGPVRFELAPIVRGSPTEAALVAFAEAHPELGARRTPEALVAADERAALEAFLARARAECAACAAPSAGAILMQSTTTGGADGAPRLAWLAHLVSRAGPVLDERAIASAEVGFDERNVPFVMLRFDAAGAERFAALTREHVGDAIAIAVDGEVVSAPVVRSEITGGAAQIAMGTDGSPQEVLASAQRLVAELRGRVELPAGTSRAWADLVAAAPGAVLAARLVTMAGAALLALALALVAARLLRFEPAAGSVGAAREGGHAGAVAARLGVTALGVAGFFALQALPLPGVEVDALPPGALERFGLATLGIGPVLLGSVLVSLVVALAPPLRRLRGGGLDARRALRPALMLTVLALCGVEGRVVVWALQADAALVGLEAPGVVVLAAITLGTFGVWGLAWLISTRGLGNGLATLTAATGIAALVPWAGHADGRAAAVLLAVAALTLRVTGLCAADGHGRARRLPLAGFAPIYLAAVALQLAMLVPALGLAVEGATRLGDGRAAVIVGVGVGGLALAWHLARPMTPRAFAPAAAASVGLLVLVALARGSLGSLMEGDPTRALDDVLALVIAPVILADLARELRMLARSGDLACAASTSDVDLAQAMLAALDQAGVAAALRGVRARALLRFMGPWLPIEVLVPRAELARAEVVLRAHANAEVVTAFGD